jgi:hypothetical protein
MSIAGLPLPRRTRGGGSNFLFSVAARQRQMFSRDGHLWSVYYCITINDGFYY